mmetsp:Transcript_15730/g.21621  ORF Transcript_15730/g.21621 Transcript_15730/m.21621 type:complete len:449 (+) Transcript_15730:13-1359(+)
MRETITVQVGQCGNQIGNLFWQLLLLEHEKTPDTDDALSAYFRFEPSGKQGNFQTHAMKARALLIDMECGPLQETMKSPIGSLFDHTQYVMDVSGSGNNFAHGHYAYGPQYRSRFEEGLRKNAENCDSLQTFLVTHSLGGGTGSGVGTYVLSMLSDLFPKISRFSACVYPSEDNDVVTSPYNTVLAMKQLVEHADCVFPMDNSSLFNFSKLETANLNKVVASNAASSAINVKEPIVRIGRKDKGFDAINAVAARMLCNLTSSSRFHGEMNVDLNEIYTNLVPFPKLHFLMTALNIRHPLSVKDQINRQRAQNNQMAATTSSSKPPPRPKASDASRVALQRCFSDVFSSRGQITAGDPTAKGCVTLASAFLARGEASHVPLSDFLKCVTESTRKHLQFPHWNQDACKIGMCNTASPGDDVSVLAVYNSTAFSSVLAREHTSFSRLYRFD